MLRTKYCFGFDFSKAIYYFCFLNAIFSPVSPNETLFTGYSFSTKLEELSASVKMVVDAMNDSVVKFNRVVFNEDKEICEAVQLGTEESESKGILGELEKRVYEFQSAYNSLISQKV